MARRHQGEITITKISNHFDLLTRIQLKQTFQEYVRAGRFCHIIDLRDIPPLDSRMLAGLISALRVVRQVGGSVHLVVTDPKTQRLLKVTGLDRIFHVYVSLEDAQRSVSPLYCAPVQSAM